MLFVCGQRGCDVVSVDAEAVAIADENTRIFADAWRELHGEYPLMEEQAERWEMAYITAARSIKRMKARCQRKDKP